MIIHTQDIKKVKAKDKANLTFINFKSSNQPKVFNNKNTGKEFVIVNLKITTGDKEIEQPIEVSLFLNSNKYYKVWEDNNISITIIKEWKYNLMNKDIDFDAEVDGSELATILKAHGFNIYTK